MQQEPAYNPQQWLQATGQNQQVGAGGGLQGWAGNQYANTGNVIMTTTGTGVTYAPSLGTTTSFSANTLTSARN
jgi:hypothetical protein